MSRPNSRRRDAACDLSKRVSTASLSDSGCPFHTLTPLSSTITTYGTASNCAQYPSSPSLRARHRVGHRRLRFELGASSGVRLTVAPFWRLDLELADASTGLVYGEGSTRCDVSEPLSS